MLKSQYNKATPVYGEIVLDAFHPKAIFCVTDGSKLHYNYEGAKILKEKMPELEIIDLDETLYCTKERRRELFKITLYNLAAETNVANDDRVNYSSLLDYFMEAKKEGYYNLEDFKEQYISMTTIQGKNNKMIKTK